MGPGAVATTRSISPQRDFKSAVSNKLNQERGPWYILVLSLCATAWFANSAHLHNSETARLRFESEIGVIEEAIRERLNSYENMLFGTQGLFVASRGDATREQFNSYAQTLRLEKHYPGVQSMGFAKRLTSLELASHVAAMRAEGFPDYKIHPEGERAEYYSVTYVNPTTRLNSRVYGYDMFSDVLRRNAMVRARDTGLPSATGKVTLVQEAPRGAYPGFVIYLPVYKGNQAIPPTLTERRSVLSGYLFSQLRWDKVMSGVLRGPTTNVGFRVFEGDSMTGESLLYRSYRDTGAAAQDYQPRNHVVSKILFGGRNWSLDFTALPDFDSATASKQPLMTALAGSAVSLLLFGMLLQIQRRARQDHDFRQMIGEVKDYGIYMLDRDGRVATWNKGAEAIEGYQAEEIVGVHFSIFFNSDDRISGKPARVLEVAARDGRQEDEGWRLRKDGTRFWANVVITALHDRNGRLRGYTKFTRDITARKQAETAIAAKNRDLETLLQVTSHDLREPLRAIESFSRLVNDRYAKQFDDQGRDFSRRVIRAAKRMDQLLLDVLTVSRAQRLGSRAENVSGEAIVHQALGRLEQRIRETGAKISVLDGLPCLSVDETWATAALFNLIGNALKFTRREEIPEIEIGPYDCQQNQQVVGIAVRDRGPGVPPEHAERIFQLFQRAVGRNVEGTGAGLAIVREIAQRHCGHAWVEPRPGGGSEFIITFAKVKEGGSRDGKQAFGNPVGGR